MVKELERLDWLLDPKNIEIVSRYNQLLGHIEDIFRGGEESPHPVVFIVGAPRSGTTLLYQVLAHSLEVGYINNFIARFWMAPAIGTYLSEKVFKIPPNDGFNSLLGRTDEINGVHEFGYFWMRFFDSSVTDYAKIIDQKKKDILKSEVNAVSTVFDRPVVFKNLTCGLRIVPLFDLFPKAVFIKVKRDIVDNGISILRSRIKYLNTEKAWWSLQPRRIEEFKKLSVEQQIKSQILSTYEEIDAQIEKTKAPMMSFEYEHICKNPREVVESIADRLDVRVRELPQGEFPVTHHLPADDPLEKRLVKVLKEI